MASTNEELQQLNKEVVELYQNKEYSEAIAKGVQALNLGKQKLGLNHPSTATAVNNLALLYDRVGDHIKAESLHQWNQQLWTNNSWKAQAV
ncbi:MAG: tetratricopeptide repeat protein [Nitrospinae bacterium]|nr:tetratricopeptide repeat protein [Nitrospinota bacterium]